MIRELALTFIAAGCVGAPAGLGAPPAELLPLVRDLEQRVPGVLAEHAVPGAVVVLIEDRAIAWLGTFGHRRAGGPNAINDRTVFEACSLSKPVSAYLALGLVAEGALDLDTPLDSYLDDPYVDTDPRAASITARMVLSHTSGLPNWRDRDGVLMLVRAPGAGFGYSGEGFYYLQRVIENLTGESFERAARKRVLEPLGMTRSSFIWCPELGDDIATGHDRDGAPIEDRHWFVHPNAAFSLYTTPLDYARFVIAHLRAENSPVRGDLLDEMLTLQNEPDPADGERGRRGLGWAIASPRRGGYAEHRGANDTGFRCYARFRRSDGSGLVIMTNGLNGRAVWTAIRSVVDAFARFRGYRGFHSRGW